MEQPLALLHTLAGLAANWLVFLRRSGVTVDNNDLVTVAGSTSYPGLPVTSNAPQPAPVRPNVLTGFVIQLQLQNVLNVPVAPTLTGVVNAASFTTAFFRGPSWLCLAPGSGPRRGLARP